MGVMRILTDVVHRPAKILTGVVELFLGLALFSTPLFAQTLTVEPSCGVAGSSVKIGGSGWAESAVNISTLRRRSPPRGPGPCDILSLLGRRPPEEPLAQCT